MIRGPLGDKNYKPRFSGHETFALRYGWLKKAYDAILNTENQEDNRYVFSDDRAIARFGVGKNMIAAIKYWALSANIIAFDTSINRYKTTEIAKMIFDDKRGYDPYMEDSTTLWLIHWLLCSKPERTTWFYAFNNFYNILFNREELTKSVLKINEESNWGKVSPNTLKRDVDCFVNTYSARTGKKKQTLEDALESPLTELSLIKGLGKRDGYRFIRGPKRSLGLGIFGYALINFWNSYSIQNIKTLSFESIVYEPGSPGKVFLLEENDVADRLKMFSKATNGRVEWSEVAGLKQLIKHDDFTENEVKAFIEMDYKCKRTLQ